MTQVPDLESGIGPKKLGTTPDPELSGSKPPMPLGDRLDQNSDSANNTHLDLNRLSRIRQEPQETVHRYWARFLLALNKVKDCRDENMVSLFCENCTDEGLLDSISRRDIVHFADLAIIVHKYCAMESAWKTQTEFWDSTTLTKTFVRTKRANSVSHLIQFPRNQSKPQGREPYWKNGSMGHENSTVLRTQHQPIALGRVGYSGRLQKVARIFLQAVKQNNIPPTSTI